MKEKTGNATKFLQAIAKIRESGLVITDKTRKGGGMGLVGGVPYRDKGQSGVKNDMPALTQLLNDLRIRKVDVIVVWALDRLA